MTKMSLTTEQRETQKSGLKKEKVKNRSRDFWSTARKGGKRKKKHVLSYTYYSNHLWNEKQVEQLTTKVNI